MNLRFAKQRVRVARFGVLCAVVLGLLVAVIAGTGISRAQEETPDAIVIPMDAVLRLRALPSTESAILDLLDTGTTLDVIARTEDSRWLAVRTAEGRVGWVWSVYVQVNIDLSGVCVVSETNALAACAGFDADVAIRLAEIYQLGVSLGNRDNVFAKVGDSITVNPNFMYPFGEGNYNLGTFGSLQPVIDHYLAGRIGTRGENPFIRESRAAGIGWAAASVFSPRMVEGTDCLPNETPLDCEYRETQPSVALIMFGTNDLGYVPPEVYRYNLNRIVEISAARGIIPVLSTIPERRDYEEATVLFNNIVREVALAQRVPLWDYYSAMATLPDRGLTWDGVHPSDGPFGAEGAGNFASDNLYYGYVIRNLTGLQMLDAVWQATR